MLKANLLKKLAALAGAAALTVLLAGCAGVGAPRYGHRIYVSVPDQKMVVLKEAPDPEQKGKVKLYYVTEYPVSTSKFGLGNENNSNRTPLGRHVIAKKIGHNAPLYMRFKDRRPTGEIVPPNSPGRDPIVSRILWLRGTEPQNYNSYARYIYIHGTAEERRIGEPASYGCIRMKSTHVAQLFEIVSEKDEVTIVNKRLNPAAYLPPPTAPGMQPPPQGVSPQVRGAGIPVPQAIAPPSYGAPTPAMGAPDRRLPGAVTADASTSSGPAGEAPAWVKPDKATARYYRRGINPKRIFD